jgi:hypothetical protein
VLILLIFSKYHSLASVPSLPQIHHTSPTRDPTYFRSGFKRLAIANQQDAPKHASMRSLEVTYHDFVRVLDSDIGNQGDRLGATRQRCIAPFTSYHLANHTMQCNSLRLCYGVYDKINGTACSRQGDCTVDSSPLHPCLDQKARVFVTHAPLLEQYSHRVIQRDFSNGFVGIPVGRDINLHSVEHALIFIGGALNHVHRAHCNGSAKNSPAPTASPPVFSATK